MGKKVNLVGYIEGYVLHDLIKMKVLTNGVMMYRMLASNIMGIVLWLLLALVQLKYLDE
jgi:hypothetical protein